MDSTTLLILGHGWLLFCGWAKERGHFGPEFGLAVFSPIIMVIAFFIALICNLVLPFAVDAVLLAFYFYFLLPIPGMPWISDLFGWRGTVKTAI